MIRITRPGDDFTEDRIKEEEDRKYGQIAADNYAEQGRGFMHLTDKEITYIVTISAQKIAQGGRREQLEKLMMTYDPLNQYVWYSDREDTRCYMGIRDLTIESQQSAY